MKELRWIATVAGLWIALSATVVWPGGPPNPTSSDLAANTAGTDALFNVTAGVNNTAFGDNALVSDTQGVENTATGAQTMFFNTTGSLSTATADRQSLLIF